MGKKRESKPLLDKAGKVSTKNSTGSSSSANTTGSGNTPSKKSQKNKSNPTLTKPTLESVHEASLESTDSAGAKGGQRQCLQSVNDRATTGTTAEGSIDPENLQQPSAFFGVRSYIHHLNENVPSPGGSHDENYHYLIRPKGPGCAALCFKIGLSVGATLFLLGAIAIVIGYAIPRQIELRGETEDYKIVDRNAIRFNKNLDMCKLVGLTGFCCGGIVLVIALLTPTFANSYWEEDAVTEPFRVAIVTTGEILEEPRSPIPATEKIKCIQPTWVESSEK